MRKKFMPLCLIVCLCLTGCWDRVELENRGFVVSLGIDKYKDENETEIESEKNARYTISASLPNVEALASQGGKEESESVKKANHQTVAAAMGLLDSYSSQKLYYGQTKIVVWGKEVLEDKSLFREAVDALERDSEISRKLIILATEEAATEVLEAKAPGEHLVGLFVSNYYRNKNRPSAAFRLDLEEMVQQLRRGVGVIPKIEVENKEIKLGGAAVIKDHKLAGWLDDKQTRGYLWMKGKGTGAQLPADFEGDYLTLRVDKNKSKMRFYDEENRTRCVVQITVEGTIEEYGGEFSKRQITENLEALSRVYEEVIQSEVMETVRAFQEDFGVDGFGFGNRNDITQFTVESQVRVKIHGMGSVIY